jgi:hypothetical protein
MTYTKREVARRCQGHSVGERLVFAGGQRLAEDVEFVCHGSGDAKYCQAAGYTQ